MRSNNDETKKCLLNVTHNPQYTKYLRNMYTKTPRSWAWMLTLQSDLTPRISSLGLLNMRTPGKKKSPIGGLTFLDLLTINALVLLGFSNMHHATTAPLLNPNQISVYRGSYRNCWSVGWFTNSKWWGNIGIGEQSILNRIKHHRGEDNAR